MNSSSSSPSGSADRLKALVSELRSGSFLVYPTRGKTPLCKEACKVVIGIKEDRVHPQSALRYPEHAARRLRENVAGSPLEDFIPKDAILVPVPKSSIHLPDGLWPALRICEALIEERFGATIVRLIERETPVEESALAENRPRPLDHYRSFKLERSLLESSGPFVLVDDVVSRGSTMLGAACRLREAFPEAKLLCFAMARTRGHVEDIPRIMDPLVGRILWDGDKARRED